MLKEMDTSLGKLDALVDFLNGSQRNKKWQNVSWKNWKIGRKNVAPHIWEGQHQSCSSKKNLLKKFVLIKAVHNI